MPYKIVKKNGPRPYRIINLDKNKQVGSSVSRAKAEASIRARHARTR